MRKYKLIINTWKKPFNGTTKPTTLHEEIIYNEDDRKEMIDTFKEEANNRLFNGDTIVYITHTWNYSFKTPTGEEYDLYMFEDNI